MASGSSGFGSMGEVGVGSLLQNLHVKIGDSV